jgi:hypothetical protein
MIGRDRLAQPLQEYFRRNAAIEPGDETAAIKRRHGAQECQHRHCDHERDDARQDKNADGIEAHRLQRVDFLAHLHGAELGGVGAAGAACDHDADNQHADFTQHQNADHVDDVDVGAEFTKMKNALLRQDRADQKRNQKNNRHGAPADKVDLIDE